MVLISFRGIKNSQKNKSIPCSIKRVQRQGLRSVVVKNYNHKASRGKVPDDKKNVLNRDFKAETRNQKWVTDITSIHVRKEGWTYLASVMDLIHSALGYKTPQQVEDEAIQAA